MKIGLLLLIANGVAAQNYDQKLKKCIDSFHAGLNAFGNNKAAAEVERRYAVLNDCMHGQKFPAFRMATYNGEKYSSDQNAGKVVLLNFWITKSPTGVAAIPYLNELAAEYKDSEFVILSFAADQLPPLEAFLATHPVKFRVFGKSRDLINHQFNTVIGYPTNIILNKKGEVVDYRVGGGTTQDELQKSKTDLKRIIDTELSR